MIRYAGRSRALAVALLLVASTAHAQPAAGGDAKTHLAAAQKAQAAKDWETALREFTAAHAAAPSLATQTGIAQAHYELKHDAAAWQAYDALVRERGREMGSHAKAAAEARLNELAQKTGAITIRVNETGAAVVVDDKPFGTSPLGPSIRVATGPHKVRVTKDGFSPYETTADVAPNADMTVEANLQPESSIAHLFVKEKNGAPVRVIVDGVDVGAAPWQGDLPPGPHDVTVRSSTAAAPHEHVELAKGKTADVVLASTNAIGRVEFQTNDGKGVIYLDGKVVAEGSFKGELPAGPHVLAIKREGFVDFEKRFTLEDRQSVSETVTLHRGGEATETKAADLDTGERFFGGTYGGIAALGIVEPGGEGNSLETQCTQLAAQSCDTSLPVGAGLFGWLGYTWNPVGIELMVGGMYDHAAPSASFDGIDRPGANLAVVGPARTEEFSIHRLGGVGALRARVTWDSPSVRISGAIGVGLAFRRMFMDRKTTGTAAGSTVSDRFVPDSVGYTSPALSADLAAHLRFTRTTALAIGVLLWMENADRTRALAEPGHPTRTPSYDLATSTQIFFGPYLGFAFGP